MGKPPKLIVNQLKSKPSEIRDVVDSLVEPREDGILFGKSVLPRESSLVVDSIARVWEVLVAIEAPAEVLNVTD